LSGTLIATLVDHTVVLGSEAFAQLCGPALPVREHDDRERDGTPLAIGASVLLMARPGDQGEDGGRPGRDGEDGELLKHVLIVIGSPQRELKGK
jgi:hypothetical protein